MQRFIVLLHNVGMADKSKTNAPAAILPGKNDQAETEKKMVSDLKPKLEKFLIDQQVNKAAETAYKSQEKATELIEKMTKEKADVQASKLAMRAFLDLKLWEKHPAPVEFAWLTGVRSSDKKRLTVDELKSELAGDISGFSSYLVREWGNMEKQIAEGKYPNPLAESDENITFFWQKFCEDINILLRSDMKYQALGNKGLLLPN